MAGATTPSRSDNSARSRAVSSEVPLLMTRSGAQARRFRVTAASGSQGLVAIT